MLAVITGDDVRRWSRVSGGYSEGKGLHCVATYSDALYPVGVRAKQVPASPNHLWQLLRGSTGRE